MPPQQHFLLLSFPTPWLLCTYRTYNDGFRLSLFCPCCSRITLIYRQGESCVGPLPYFSFSPYPGGEVLRDNGGTISFPCSPLPLPLPTPKGDAAVLWQSNEKRSQTHLHARARLGPMPAELLIGTEEKKRRERRPPSDPFVMREREVRMMFHLRPRPHHCSGQESRHKYGCSCLACSLRSMTGKCVVSYWCEYVLLHYKLDQ